MNNKQKQEVIDLLTKSGINIDFQYHLKNEDFESADDIRDILEDAGAFNIEIIYYGRAMEYLSKNDSSLRNSLEIAAELGYSLENLNSETLASLLASQEAREEFNELEDDINDLINSFEDEDEDEDEDEA